MPGPARRPGAARAARPAPASAPGGTPGCRTTVARAAEWRSGPPLPARRDPRATRRRQGGETWDSLRQQGVALADRVARVDLHGLADRLEPGVLDADRVAARLDDVFDQRRLAGIHAVDVHLAEQIG